LLAIILAIEDEQDRSFVDWIYRTYEKKMYVEAFDILKHHEDAQDCVHETVEKIIDALLDFKAAQDMGSLGGLVLVTCRNHALNLYKQKARRRRYVQLSTDRENGEYEEVENLPDEAADVQKIVISEETCQYIQTLIGELDERYRSVLLLKSQGLDYAQIATLLGITEESARQRMVRGRKQLLEKGGKTLYER